MCPWVTPVITSSFWSMAKLWVKHKKQKCPLCFVSYKIWLSCKKGDKFSASICAGIYSLGALF